MSEKLLKILLTILRMETCVRRDYLRLDDQEVDDVHQVFQSPVCEDHVRVLERDFFEAVDDCFCHVVVHQLVEEPVEALVLDQRASGFW